MSIKEILKIIFRIQKDPDGADAVVDEERLYYCECGYCGQIFRAKGGQMKRAGIHTSVGSDKYRVK